MNFEITYDNQPLRFLKNQSIDVKLRIIDKIETILITNPVPSDAKSIKTMHGVFRIRIGKWRVLYRINYEEKTIIIVAIDHRENVY
ncbi:type II toxin-antitoxin system RelE/ParE family toxin [Candidatus Woesearchaeota archaeon]|nr:type II toxin-antitoxin system RelE/ParE family toxin [Candidatus Woesearchaeota archaeon]